MALDDTVGNAQRRPAAGYVHHCWDCKRWYRTRMDSGQCFNCYKKTGAPMIKMMTTQQAIGGADPQE